MTTAPLTAIRFGLIDPTGNIYRGMSFSTERAADQYLGRLPEKPRRTLKAAGYRVGPIEPPAVACCDPPMRPRLAPPAPRRTPRPRPSSRSAPSRHARPGPGRPG